MLVARVFVAFHELPFGVASDSLYFHAFHNWTIPLDLLRAVFRYDSAHYMSVCQEMAWCPRKWIGQNEGHWKGEDIRQNYLAGCHVHAVSLRRKCVCRVLEQHELDWIFRRCVYVEIYAYLGELPFTASKSLGSFYFHILLFRFTLRCWNVKVDYWVFIEFYVVF